MELVILIVGRSLPTWLPLHSLDLKYCQSLVMPADDIFCLFTFSTLAVCVNLLGVWWLHGCMSHECSHNHWFHVGCLIFAAFYCLLGTGFSAPLGHWIFSISQALDFWHLWTMRWCSLIGRIPLCGHHSLHRSRRLLLSVAVSCTYRK